MMSSILHGYIHSWSSDPACLARNEHALSCLPESGAWIIRPMLSLLPNSKGHCYYGHLMHFSAYYKDFYSVDRSFIEEFECVLGNLCWDEAALIHAWSNERFVWKSSGSEVGQAARIACRKRFESAHDLKVIGWDS
jgi:hypothetical protein